MTDAAIHTRSTQVDRMSPAALALAVFLHALVALGMWWISPLKPLLTNEDTIDVTVERGGAAPAQEPSPIAAPPIAAMAAEPDPPPQTLAPPQPLPQAQPAPPTPAIEQALPPPEVIPPPTATDFPKPAPRPQPLPQQRPAQATQPRPPPDNQAAALRPSPLHNPPDILVGSGAPGQNEYLLLIARRLAQYRYYPRVARELHEQGRVVMRLMIARDGNLVDARVEQSSGSASIDAAELETVRKASPYPSLPPQIPGERAIFIVPVHYHLRDPRLH